MQLAQGDTSNPFIFGRYGIKSPFGQAETTFFKLLRGQISFEEVVSETGELLEDCDFGHTRLQVTLPQDQEAHDIAIQWALIGPRLLLKVQHLKGIIEHDKKPSRSDFARIAVIHDLLSTRFMTFLTNGLVSLV